MIDLLTSMDDSGFSTDPSRPDYACPLYLEMAPRWTLVADVRAGTPEIRAKKERYLPKFEAETVGDWDARVNMTFVADHYTTTLTEHVGLVMAEPLKLGEDVPPAIEALTEDIDGEGNHLDVFAQSVLDAALHYGHAVILTDYPVTDNIRNLTDARLAQARPYATLYPASDILSWRFETVGGVKVLVRIVLRERGSAPDGEFGVKEVVRYRELSQAVMYNELTGRATGLGAITWRVWSALQNVNAAGAVQYMVPPGAEGTIIGPTRIAARIVYGGEKLGPLHSKPHLNGLALSNIEETQVQSDYGCVMHKCNVPTPIFIGRQPSNDGSQTVQMGQGIDIPVGGDAKMLEPSGAALGATRTRLQDIQAQMRRQGATMDDATATEKTAAEARLYAAQRNAKLRRAARSLQDALEGMLADFAAFMGIASSGSVKSGGSITVNQDFSGTGIDPAYLSAVVQAYKESALTLEELRYVIQTGQLPETFDPDDVVELLARQAAAEERARQEAEDRAAQMQEGVAA